MNRDRIQQQLRQICQDAIAIIVAKKGKAFWETMANLIADQYRQGKYTPDEIGRLKLWIEACPILAHHLIKHFPKAEWIKEVATQA